MLNNITNIESTMNARKELEEILNKLKEKQNVLVCADISYEEGWDGKEQITLTHPHTKEEAEAFFENLQNYNDAVGLSVGVGPLDFRTMAGEGDVLDLIRVLERGLKQIP